MIHLYVSTYPCRIAIISQNTKPVCNRIRYKNAVPEKIPRAAFSIIIKPFNLLQASSHNGLVSQGSFVGNRGRIANLQLIKHTIRANKGKQGIIGVCSL